MKIKKSELKEIIKECITEMNLTEATMIDKKYALSGIKDFNRKRLNIKNLIPRLIRDLDMVPNKKNIKEVEEIIMANLDKSGKLPYEMYIIDEIDKVLK